MYVTKSHIEYDYILEKKAYNLPRKTCRKDMPHHS